MIVANKLGVVFRLANLASSDVAYKARIYLR